MTEGYIVKLITAFHVGLLDTHSPLPEGFDRELRSALAHKQTSFEYGSTTFIMESNLGYSFIYARFGGIPGHTPAAFFHGGVPLGEVHITAFELPNALRAAPGWYYRDEDVGQFLSWVHVDPYGDNPYSEPVITARGKHLNTLVAFFNEVLAGKLEPQKVP